MGNDGVVGLVVGVSFIIGGIIVAIITANKSIEQARLLEFLSAFEGYLIGAIIAIVLIVIGGFILFLAGKD